MGELGTADASAWKEFWARNAKAGAGGCLPARWTALENAQKEVWFQFIEAFPANPRVLDLATGDGRVLAWLSAATTCAEAIGIDRAPHLPPAPPGARLLGGVGMEDLPFADASFDIVTSQFGFEYGDTRRTAQEIVRVIAPAGCIGLMVHRGDGPILAHNAVRRAQIDWVLHEAALFAAVRTMLDDGGGIAQAMQLAAATAQKGARQWGEGSAAWEIPEAVRRTLVIGETGPRKQIDTTLDQIAFQARSEMGRIDTLGRACRAADDREMLLAGFVDGGFALTTCEAVRDPEGRAFADFLTISAA